MSSAGSQAKRERARTIFLRVFKWIPVGALATSVLFDAFAIGSGNMRWAHMSVLMIAAAITGL